MFKKSSKVILNCKILRLILCKTAPTIAKKRKSQACQIDRWATQVLWLFKCFLIDLPTFERFSWVQNHPPPPPYRLSWLCWLSWPWCFLGVCLLNTEPGDLRILLPGQQVAAVIHLSRCHSCQCCRCCCLCCLCCCCCCCCCCASTFQMLGRRLFCAPEGRGKGRGNAICIMPAREGECKGEGNLHKSGELRALECRRKAEGVGIKGQRSGTMGNGLRHDPLY